MPRELRTWGRGKGASQASASSVGAGRTAIVRQFIPESFLLAGGVELTGSDLPLTHRQHLQAVRGGGSGQEALLPNGVLSKHHSEKQQLR